MQASSAADAGTLGRVSVLWSFLSEENVSEPGKCRQPVHKVSHGFRVKASYAGCSVASDFLFFKLLSLQNCYKYTIPPFILTLLWL